MIKKDNVSKKRRHRNIVLKFLRGNCQIYDYCGIVVTIPMRLYPLSHHLKCHCQQLLHLLTASISVYVRLLRTRLGSLSGMDSYYSQVEFSNPS